MDNIELQKYAKRDIDILRILNINTTFRGYYLNNDEVKKAISIENRENSNEDKAI